MYILALVYGWFWQFREKLRNDPSQVSLWSMLSTVALARIEFYRTIKPAIPGEMSGWFKNDVGYLGECVNGLIGLYSGGAPSNECAVTLFTCLVFYKHSERLIENQHGCDFVAASARQRPRILRRGMEHAGLYEARAFSNQAISRFANCHLSPITRSSYNPRICLFIYCLVAICGHTPLRLRLRDD